jgi:hypothetical protein
MKTERCNSVEDVTYLSLLSQAKGMWSVSFDACWWQYSWFLALLITHRYTRTSDLFLSTIYPSTFHPELNYSWPRMYYKQYHTWSCFILHLHGKCQEQSYATRVQLCCCDICSGPVPDMYHTHAHQLRVVEYATQNSTWICKGVTIAINWGNYMIETEKDGTFEAAEFLILEVTSWNPRIHGFWWSKYVAYLCAKSICQLIITANVRPSKKYYLLIIRIFKKIGMDGRTDRFYFYFLFIN